MDVLMNASSGQAEHVGRFLSIYLQERCKKCGICKQVTLKELLLWRPWPTYITLYSEN